MYEILVSGLVSFLLVMFLMPWWIRRAHRKGLVGKDMNKKSKPKIAETGGVVVFLSFIMGVLVLSAINYLSEQYTDMIVIMISLFSISIITLIAYIDDVSGWKKGFVRWKKPLITITAVIPLLPFMLGRDTITVLGNLIALPYLFYPLVMVPIGFVVATNAVNLLGGFNGLEAGLGIIGFTTLLWFAWGTPFASLIVIAIACMIGFLWFNRYPSRVFPGDTLTYFIGGTFAIVAVFGYFQTVTILIMAPYILEGIIKSREIHYIWRNKRIFKPECFGRVQRDGSIKAPYPQIWSTTHMAMRLIRRIKGKCYENDVTLLMVGLYAIWCIIIINFLGMMA